MWFNRDRDVQTGKFSLDGIKTIWVRSVFHDIRFYHTEESELVVKEYGSAGNAKVERRGDDALCLDASDEKQHFGFGINIGLKTSCRLELYVPESFRGQIYVESKSGDIIFDAAWSMLNLQVKSGVGDISLGSVRAEHILVETGSGDIDIGEACGDRQVFTQCGDICVEGGTGRLHVETKSGDVDINGLDTETKISSASGDVCAVFRAVGGNAEISSTSGDVDVKIAADGSFGIEAKTGSGDIVTHLEQTQTIMQSACQVTAWTNCNEADRQKAPVIHVSSASGDICLHN